MASPPRTSPPPSAPTGGTARWLNVVTTTVLGAAVLIVVAAAVPSLVRAGARSAGEPGAFPPPVREHHPTLLPRDHPRSFPFATDPAERPDDDDAPPRALSPNDPRAAAPRLPGQDRDDDDPLAFGIKSGVTLKPLLLRDRRTGTVLHTVKPGEPVSVLREEDEWLLVVHRATDDLVTGWARRSELLLR